MNLLAEGVESIKLACSLVLLIPALGVILLGRRRIWLVPAWIITSSLIAWLRFTGWFTPQQVDGSYSGRRGVGRTRGVRVEKGPARDRPGSNGHRCLPGWVDVDPVCR